LIQRAYPKTSAASNSFKKKAMKLCLIQSIHIKIF
jgi:hypothetical protein